MPILMPLGKVSIMQRNLPITGDMVKSLAELLVRISLRIMRPNPLGIARPNKRWVLSNCVPVSILLELLVHKPHLLAARHPLEAQFVVRAGSIRSLGFAGELQTGCQSHSVFDCLRSAVTRGGQKGVGGVAELDDAAAGRRPLLVGISELELPVHDGAFGGCFNEGCYCGMDGVVLFHGGDDFGWVDVWNPGFAG